MEKVGRACIFCQRQSEMSNEHIFPKWLQEHLGIKQEVLYIYSSDSEEPKRTLVFDKHLNGKVCRDCNNGWMSNIENSVKPILISMLDCVSPINVTADHSMILAWWICKTALTLHSASPYGSVIPQRHYELALQQIAPANFMIAIAYCAERVEKPAWIQNQSWAGLSRFIQPNQLESQLKNTYRITFGFGNFVARVHYFPLRYRLFEIEQGAVQYIHPGNRDGFDWPLQSAIHGITDLDRSIVVNGDPVQDAQQSERFLEQLLNEQKRDDRA